MDLTAQLDLGDLRLRTLLPDDAELLIEATRQEQGRALWGPRHCRAWFQDGPARDRWHDCLIFAHTLHGLRRSIHAGVD
jgi:hypothetical protein